MVYNRLLNNFSNLLIQWGYVYGTYARSTATAENYTIAFPNNMFSLIGTKTASSVTAVYNYVVKPSTLSQFTITQTHSTSVEMGVCWIAVGN